MLKPQDVVVTLKLFTASAEDRTFPRLAADLGMSASEVHAAMKRAAQSGLVDWSQRAPKKAALCEFLIHGLRYVFPPQVSGVTRGVPTSYAAPPLSTKFAPSELPPVWPSPDGDTRGEAFEPLCPCVPHAARRDPRLYEWLALVDAIRGGRARERALASAELERRLA